MKDKVTIKDLQFGMYVFELDRPWTETPFMFQGFNLRTKQQLEVLKKYCEYVYVDSERSYEDPDVPPPAAPEPKRPTGPLPGTRRITHVEHVEVGQELAPARDARVFAESAVADAFATVKAGGALDAGTVQAAVSKMSESIMRNPDALMLFSALKERGGYFLDRAMNCSIYMITFTRFLGMEQADIERAGVVGLLEDVGMLQIQESVLAKPGPLAPDEIRLVRTHVERGKETILASGTAAVIAEIASQHHEREDGSGYPRGLRGP